MSGKAYLGTLHPDLEDAALERVMEARKGDPSSPITVLVGSNLLGAHLRRRLAERALGHFNVRFLTFADLARSIADGGSGEPRRPLPAGSEEVIVEDLLRGGFEGAAGFGAVSRARGFAGALVETFSDLSEAGCTSAIARAALGREAGSALGERARSVLSLFARFRERVEELGGDIHSTFAEALAAPLPGSIGPVVLAYGFYDVNELQWRLLARLARERDLALFVPSGEGEAWRFGRRMRDRLAEAGFTSVAAPAAREGESRPRPRLLDAPGAEEEIREIARRSLALAEERGIRFGEMAVLLPSPEAYLPLCREVFDEAGIPYFLHAAPHALGSPSARGVLGLLDVVSGEMDRRGLIEFLSSAPLRPPGGAGDGSDLAACWARESAKAGLTGEGGWLEESEALLQRLRLEAEERDDRRAAFAAAAHVDGIIRSLAAARAAAARASTWGAFARLAGGLVRDLFVESEDTEETLALIDGVRELERVAPRASLESFSRLLERVVSFRRFPVGRLGGEGINVLTFEQARGLSFRAVFIPALAEGLFPSAARQDPFLGDAERREIARITRGAAALPERRGRLSEEALLFEIARASARETLVLSFPRIEEGAGRERIASSFLRYVAGYSIDGEHGPALDVERVPRGGAPRPEQGLLSAHELDFKLALAYREGKGLLPANRFFSRGAALVRGRWGTPTFTEYDGVFSSPGAIAELRAMLEERGRRFAPTALEAYAGCPFSYFCRHVLGIDVVEEPERILTISPQDRGILVHEILAALFRELERERLLPVREAPVERLREIAGRIISVHLDAFPKRAPVGLPVFWDMESRLVREAIGFLLEEERVEEGDFVPAHFERSFGRPRDRLDVSYDHGNGTVFFYGRVDRIDVGGAGRFRVIDYKTGSLSGDDQDLAGGGALQLPIYLMAAARMLERPIEEGEALYRYVGTGKKKGAVRFAGERWRESEPLFARIIGTITSGIESGLFLAPADERSCSRCDVGTACPAGMPRLFARKGERDRRARPYLAMRSGEEGEE